jgi:hypothetical protein
MTTIYLGGNFVSYDDPRSSHLSKQAREAVYFEQFKPENLREIRVVPTLALIAGVSIGILALGSFLGDDVTESTLDAGSREAGGAESFPRPSPPQRVGEAGEIRLDSKRIERPSIGEP